MSSTFGDRTITPTNLLVGREAHFLRDIRLQSSRKQGRHQFQTRKTQAFDGRHTSFGEDKAHLRHPITCLRKQIRYRTVCRFSGVSKHMKLIPAHLISGNRDQRTMDLDGRQSFQLIFPANPLTVDLSRWCTELHIPMDRKLWPLGLPIDVWYCAVQEGSLLETRKSEHQAGDCSILVSSSDVTSTGKSERAAGSLLAHFFIAKPPLFMRLHSCWIKVRACPIRSQLVARSSTYISDKTLSTNALTLP
ncbi:hypothetical protein T12_5577 [Trichinella patagoniensis]|uniref:Uncharacterized protein n=1 Tax=Trichinella patagoniensis TaxID=990121 RepID=A0A0V0ZVR6_9BILA|nr:hypothetical protein T12_5577 [Trichinella patagoniensis]